MAAEEVIYGRDVPGGHRANAVRVSGRWCDWWEVAMGYADSYGTTATTVTYTRWGARRLARRWLRGDFGRRQ